MDLKPSSNQLELKRKRVFGTVLICLAGLLIIFLMLLLIPADGKYLKKTQPTKIEKETDIESFANKLPDVDFKGGEDGQFLTLKLDSISQFKEGIFIKKDTFNNKPYQYPIKVFKNDKLFTEDIFTCLPYTAFLRDAYFNSDLNFTSCRFRIKNDSVKADNFNFENVEVNGLLKFTMDSLNSHLSFKDCVFHDAVNMTSSAVIGKSISFKNCDFLRGFSANDMQDPGSTNPPNLKTNGDLTFQNCNFQGRLDFRFASFYPKTKILLENCNPPDTIDLSGLKADVVNITGTTDTTDKVTYLNLTGSDINSLNLNYSHFKLYFSDNATDDQITGIYQHLLKNFKDNGFDSSFEKLDAEFRHRKAVMGTYSRKGSLFRFCDKHISKNFGDNLWTMLNGIRLSVLGDWINRAWWNYGYDRVRVIYWSLLIVILLAWFNSYRYAQLLEIFYVEKLDPKLLSGLPDSVKKKAIKHYYILVYTGFIFFKIDFDFKNMNFASRYMVILLTQYLIGLICTAFIINLVLGK